MSYLHREGIMLCHPAEEKRVKKFPELFIAQPKLNGERCRVEWYEDRPILLSSYGNEFKGLSHITNALVQFMPKDIKWDGELYVHGWSRERIHSAVSRKKNASNDAGGVQFHIFDYQDFSKSQIQRCADIGAWFHFVQSDPVYPVLQRVETFRTSKSEWIEHCQSCIEKGYEGIILRHPYALYEEKRSVNCLKFKPTEHDDYTIVGFNQEIDIHGVEKEALGSFVVTSDEGTQFSVGTGPALTRERREYYWKHRHELLGHVLTVKHEALKTVNNVPIATVAVQVSPCSV